MNTKITFEDHGQDFLEWLIDKDGKVIDCEPFQASIWCKHTVINMDKLMAGAIVRTDGGEWAAPGTNYLIKYPVESIEVVSYKLI